MGENRMANQYGKRGVGEENSLYRLPKLFLGDVYLCPVANSRRRGVKC